MYRGLNDLFPLIEKWWRTGLLMDFLLLIHGGDDDFHVGNDDAALSSRWYLVFLVQTASGHWLHCQFRGSPTWWPILSVYGSPIYDQPRIAWTFLLSSAFWDFRQIYENSKEFVIFRNNLVLKNSNRFQSFWGHTLADPPFPWDKNFVLFCSRVWCMSTGWGSFPSNETAQIGQPDDSKSHNSL